MIAVADVDVDAAEVAVAVSEATKQGEEGAKLKNYPSAQPNDEREQEQERENENVTSGPGFRVVLIDDELKSGFAHYYQVLP